MGENGCFRHKEKIFSFRPQITIVPSSTSCVIRDERMENRRTDLHLD